MQFEFYTLNFTVAVWLVKLVRECSAVKSEKTHFVLMDIELHEETSELSEVTEVTPLKSKSATNSDSEEEYIDAKQFKRSHADLSQEYRGTLTIKWLYLPLSGLCWLATYNAIISTSALETTLVLKFGLTNTQVLFFDFFNIFRE